MFNGRSAPVAPGEEAAVLDAQRATAPMAVLTSMLGDRFHRIHFWFASAHVSLISGVTGERAVHRLDDRRAVDAHHQRLPEPRSPQQRVALEIDLHSILDIVELTLLGALRDELPSGLGRRSSPGRT